MLDSFAFKEAQRINRSLAFGTVFFLPVEEGLQLNSNACDLQAKGMKK